MDIRTEVRDFLSSRRARLTPEQAGLPAWGTNRRVKGLRREEVALLAGVSAEYYVRLERGNLAGVSEQVLEAVANALQLDDAERAHLFGLARTASARKPTGTPRSPVRPAVQWLLDSMTGTAAYVRNNRTDLLADSGLRLNAYVAEPGTPSAEAFSLLASWAAFPTRAAEPATNAATASQD